VTDPRLTFATPFANVRPGVAYVGDETCALCHVTHAETFGRHPMGRSLAPVAAHPDRVRYDRAANDPFEKFGSLYRVERRGDRVFHSETDRGPHGEAHFTQEAEIAYVIGSGAHGYSYLIDHDGYLFYSPISWYAQGQRWNLSPGPAAPTHFTRAATEGCLFCHCNQADAVEGTDNRFHPPVFHGYAVGCERCHGPGELHVALRERGEWVEGTDVTIVNPGRLEPALRDAVCEQCHLQGVSRVLRRGRRWFDYRPGLPLSLFLSVFVRPDRGGPTDVVGHVEQMRLSRCYRGSGGRLGCVSCHDPHRLPEPAEKISYYRARCLACHGETSCALAPPARRRRDPADSCAGCHMPHADTVSVGHVALTDHRILRRPGARPAPPPGVGPAEAGDPFVPFYREEAAAEPEEAARDYGLALMEVARSRRVPGAETDFYRTQGSERALPALEQAVARAPDDVPAREARAHALWFLGRTEEALADFEAALRLAPEREDCLAGAAHVAELLGRADAACDYAERLVRVNPWSAEHRQQWARALAARHDWPKAAAQCREALALNPFAGPVRTLRIQCLLAAGDRAEAEAELKRLLPMVENPEAVRRWFAEQAGDAWPGGEPGQRRVPASPP
jgi:Tfp pilus assembly protein PilF